MQKIVSIEYKENLLEITDYYYDKGKINFIFKREEAVYTPTYATTKKTGDRFFFSDDRMTTWRQVNKPDKLKDYIAHAPKETKKVEGVKKTERYYTLSEEESSQFGKKQMNQEKQMEFDAMEIRMLNEAYQVYQVVLEAENVAFISGYVVDVNGNPIPGASVRVFSTEYEVFVGEALTDESGKYQIAALASTSGYDLFISKEGMIEVKVYDVSISEQSLALYQETVYLIPLSSAGDYSLTLLLYDSINKNTEITENFYENEYGGENPYLGNSMMPLAYANLNIREGMNNRNGTIIRSDKADAYGYVAIRLPAGIYTGEIRKDGYINSYFTIISKRNGDYITSNSSPILGEDEIRIVLTWGSNPSDLDSHLFTPYQGSGGDMQHIGFNRRVDDHGNNLDVDDRSSYGPETITINKLGGGSYKYFVVDYSNCSSRDLKSLEMSYSNARVDVYTKDGLQQVFFVPRQQRGVIWEVFEIKNKQVIPINRYYNNTDDKDWWQEDRGVYSSEEIGGK